MRFGTATRLVSLALLISVGSASATGFFNSPVPVMLEPFLGNYLDVPGIVLVQVTISPSMQNSVVSVRQSLVYNPSLTKVVRNSDGSPGCKADEGIRGARVLGAAISSLSDGREKLDVTVYTATFEPLGIGQVVYGCLFAVTAPAGTPVTIDAVEASGLVVDQSGNGPEFHGLPLTFTAQ